MKKFTLLLVFVVISFTVLSQNNNFNQKKLKQTHEKYLKFSEMLKRVEMQTSSKSGLLKSTAATLKLDSIVSWNLDLLTEQWKYDYKDEYFYNSTLQNTSWLNSEWDTNTQKFDITGKTELEFNNQGLVSSMLLYDLNEEAGELEQASEFMIFYNPEGLQDSALMYVAEVEGGPLVLAMKQYRKYNEAKQLIQTDVWTPNEEEGDLILSQLIINRYYGSGLIDSTITKFLFDTDFITFALTDYDYDGSGNLTSVINSTINFFTFSMEYTDRNTYIHNASGKVREEIYSVWESGAWLFKEKGETEFNTVGDPSVDTYSEWDGTKWVISDKDEYAYGSMDFSDIVMPYFFGPIDFMFMVDMEGVEEINFNKQVTEVKTYEMMNGEWKYNGRSTLYYSPGTSTNINETDNANFAVYPNPATESVSFRWKGNYENLTLVLYQVTGSRVLEQTTTSGKSVSISNLENGVYLFKLIDGQQSVKTGKLIKN